MTRLETAYFIIETYSGQAKWSKALSQAEKVIHEDKVHTVPNKYRYSGGGEQHTLISKDFYLKHAQNSNVVTFSAGNYWSLVPVSQLPRI